MYSYGQFAKTPVGRMRVRKEKDWPCFRCNFLYTCEENSLNEFCINNIPEDAYLEKPSIGGKDHTSN